MEKGLVKLNVLITPDSFAIYNLKYTSVYYVGNIKSKYYKTY